MPYVITTLWSNSPAEAGHDVTRHAVATLEEARELTAGIVHGFEIALGRTLGDAYATALTRSEQGGTVGPLPDGTLIEVERTTYVYLADEGGWVWPADDTDYSSPARHADAVLAAFNAKQAA